MNENIKETKPSKTFEFVSELCKGRTEQELVEAEARLHGLLLVIKGICDRLTDQNEPLPEIDNTENV